MQTYFKGCSHFPTKIFHTQDGDVSYFASDRFGIKSFNGDLIINLTNEPGVRAASTTYDIPQLSKHMQIIPNEIVLAWTDYNSPPVKSSFWKALHNYVKQKHYNNVAFHCEFGHGRTGTALSAMLISLLELDVVSAISILREDYCVEAVESDSQINYLINLDLELNGGGKVLSEENMKKLLSNLRPITKISKFQSQSSFSPDAEYFNYEDYFLKSNMTK